MITVGSSGTLGTGGMVITDGSDGRRGRWRCGGSLGAGACRGGACCVGACRGGAAGGAVVPGALSDELVVLVVLSDGLVVLVELVVLDELDPGVVLPPPGPRLVNWTIPQITSPSITAMSPNQAISTERRRNHGVGDTAATLGSVVGSSSNGL